jgi:hypothetical protein
MFNENEFEHAGMRFRWKLEDDTTMGRPWDEHDGHGPVRVINMRQSGERVEKRPGERVLYVGGWHEYTFVYDWQAAVQIALRDGWGAPEGHFRPGSNPTRRQVAAAAAQADFDRLRGWITNAWGWVGVVVELLDDQDEVADTASLWGIESDSPGYHLEVAQELAEELAHPRLAAAAAREAERELTLVEGD